MPHVTGDRVKDTTTTTGTGNITVSGSAPTGFRTLSAVATADSDTLFLAIVGGAEWEVCLATRVSANVYARTTILASSNAGAAVNFSAGTKDVFITLPASKIADDTAYASTWDGDTATAPSRNAVYDALVGTIFPKPIAANWSALSSEAMNTGAVVAISFASSGRLFSYPILIREPTTLSDLGFFCNTQESGKLCALALYANNPATGRPTGTPLAATGDISLTGTGYKSADITGSNVSVVPGLYWASIWSDSTTAQFSAVGGGALSSGGVLIGNATLASAITTSGVHSTTTFNSAAWPDLTGASFTVLTAGNELLLLGKHA